MGIAYGAKTVRGGLIIDIDPSNPKSYSGTGSSVTDMSGENIDGTFAGGTTFSSANNGVFTFDGVNSVINFGIGETIFPLPEFSIEIWFSSDGTTPTTGTSPGLLGFTYGIRLFVGSNSLSYGVDNGTSLSLVSSPSTYNFYDSSWHHVVMQASPVTRYLYIDGELANTHNNSWSGTTRWPTNSINIGRDNNNVNYFFRGKTGPVKVYNRVLSASEVSQNFKAVRGRYGI